MRDMRKKALTESLKTTSRKARRRPDSLAGSTKSTPQGGSNSSSRHASRHASTTNSRAGSRYASEDESAELAGSVQNLRLAGHAVPGPPRYRRGFDGNDAADESNDDDGGGDESDADNDDSFEELGDEDLAGNAALWRVNFRNVIATLEDRKHASVQDRTRALTKYGRLLRAIFSSEAISGALPSILEQLLKSIRKSSAGESEEKRLALADLAITVLSCSDDSEAADVFDKSFSTVKRVVQDPDADEADKAAALQALGVVVLVGSGLRSTVNELLNFLLEIVETDGDSVSALDSAPVVTAAIRMWTFTSSFLVSSMDDTLGGQDLVDDDHDADAEDEDDEEPEEEDEEDDEEKDEAKKKKKKKARAKAKAKADKEEESQQDKDAEVAEDAEDADVEDESDKDEDDDGEDEAEVYFSSESQRALEAFVEQLESTDVDVQVNAGIAVALLYEASRKHEAVHGRPLQLQQDPLVVAEHMKTLSRSSSRSTKSMNRQARRQIRDNFRSVITSLELGVGPGFTTSGQPKYRSEKPGTTAQYVYDSDDGTGGSFANAFDLNFDPNANTGQVEAHGHQMRLMVGDRSMAIDTWGLSVRVDMLRAVLGSGMTVHLLRNRRVHDIVQAQRMKHRRSGTSNDFDKMLEKTKQGKTPWNDGQKLDKKTFYRRLNRK